MSVIETIIETQEFATLPNVAARVLQILDDEAVNVRDIARVIETDSSLTLKLLRVANSPLYGTVSEVTSIQQSIITLGLSRLTNIVLGISIFSRFMMNTNKDIVEYLEKFWWHAASTGMVAKSFSTKINRFFKENEFIGGLLHDIGKLALFQYDNKKYMQVIELIEKEGFTDIAAEIKIFGVDHTEVGGAIAKTWRLPSTLHDIIRYHHTPELAENNLDLVAAIRFTDILCEVWGAGFHEGITKLDMENTNAWKVLKENIKEMEEVDLEVFTIELEDEFKKTSVFLDIISSDI